MSLRIGKMTPLEELDRQIDELVETVTVKQHKFALALHDGTNATKAARLAGYSEANARVNAGPMKRNSKVQALLKLMSQKYQLEHGIHPAVKRAHLIKVANKAERDKQYAASVGAVKLLCEIDGDIKQNNAAGAAQVAINVSTGIDRGNVTIDGQAVAEPAQQEQTVDVIPTVHVLPNPIDTGSTAPAEPPDYVAASDEFSD